MSSILTNNSAIVALDTLRNINYDLESVQNEIATGKKISSSTDNAAIWSIATVLESDVNSFDQVSDSLNLGSATVGVAQAGAEQVTELLTEAKALIVGASDPSVSDADRAKYQTDLTELTSTVSSIVDAASFNGQNLLKGADSIDILSSLNRQDDGTVTAGKVNVARQDLTTAAGGGLEGLAAIDVTSLAGAASGLDAIDALLQTAIDATAQFGSKQSRLDNQNEFITNLSDALTTGIGALTDANLEEASAKLQSLQVQQQLGVQALSIANSAPQQLLSLFR